MGRPATNLLGRVFGKLKVVERMESSKAGAARWKVLCECGAQKVLRSSQLTDQHTGDCGCMFITNARKRLTTHGMTDTLEFRVWTAMRKRCTYTKHPAYHLYGGRGITVCERWGCFNAFYIDMGACPFLDGSIDRIDNQKGYDVGNCRWLPRAQQSKNRSNVPLYDGLTLPEVAKKHGIAYGTLRNRVMSGVPKEQWFHPPRRWGGEFNGG